MNNAELTIDATDDGKVRMTITDAVDKTEIVALLKPLETERLCAVLMHWRDVAVVRAFVLKREADAKARAEKRAAGKGRGKR